MLRRSSLAWLITCSLITCSLLAPPCPSLLPTAHAFKIKSLKQRYEDQLVRWALREAGLKREPAPEGKRIARIVIVRENIIAKSDPWPTLLNVVHFKTRDYVIRQELLVREGERWDGARVAESERNLRALLILATARTVACKAARADEVVLLVVTKDIWSIRLNMVYSQNGPVVKLFDATPTEANFLGRNKRLSLHLRVSQLDLDAGALRDHLALGARYLDHRMLGTRLQLYATADAIVDGEVPCGGSIADQEGVWCPSGKAGELAGLAASLSLTRPLYSLATKWGFSLSGSVDVRQRRSLRQADTGALALRPIRIGDDLVVPDVYDGRRLQGSLSFTRSYGQRHKHDISWGLSAYQLRYTPPDNFPFGREVNRLLMAFIYPRSETATSFFVRYGLRTTRYIRLRNVQGFALSEDFSIGPGVSLGVSFGQNLEEPRQSFVSLSASAAYRWHIRGDLLHVSLSASTRLQPELELAGYEPPLVNSTVSAAVKNISPVLWIGRLHVQALVTLVDDNLDRARFYLGGDSGLRGYPADRYEGRNLLRINAEFRSLPVNLWTLHLGFVLFYDGGSTWANPFPEGDDVPLTTDDVPFAYRQTAGVGIRGHFPQFDRESLRIDFGFPFSSDRGALGTWFNLSFGQVF